MTDAPSFFDDDEEYPKAIRDALERLNGEHKQIMRYLEDARVVEEVVQKMVDEGICERGDFVVKDDPKPRIRTSIGWEISSLNGALISMYVRNIREALPVLRELRKRGYKVTSHDDFAEVKRRSYRMGSITLSTFLNDANATICKYVQIGVKEEPVYELQCDGQKVNDLEAVTSTETE